MGNGNTNREGMTLAEWVSAARCYTNASGPATGRERKAWREGVDPAEFAGGR